jgi:CDP-glucose 4,6-dehydratase
MGKGIVGRSLKRIVLEKRSVVKLEGFFRGKRIFLTGHTGFKGSWMCLWLHALGAKVAGYALEPPTEPNLFDLAGVKDTIVSSHQANVRDLATLRQAMQAFGPEIVVHMAAQPLVRESYLNPVDTYAINVMGTVHLLEAVRHTPGVRAVLNVTTDKCYENREWIWGYRENEPMGGYDPYSSSKACSELVTSAYRRSFFSPATDPSPSVLPCLASARAGNVIGGGDWGVDRLVPDCMRALLKGETILIRSPQAIRPWQHVLEPLSGYLLLIQRLIEDGPSFADAWNFGPGETDAAPVEWVVQTLCEKWGTPGAYTIDNGPHPHEAHYLKLDCSKARSLLGWHPRWGLEKAIDATVEWTREYQSGADLRKVCLRQIEEYEAS